MSLFAVCIYNLEHKQSGLFNFTIFSSQNPAFHRFQWFSRNSLIVQKTWSFINILHYVDVWIHITEGTLEDFSVPLIACLRHFMYNLFIFRLADYINHTQTSLQDQDLNLPFFLVSQNLLLYSNCFPIKSVYGRFNFFVSPELYSILH